MLVDVAGRLERCDRAIERAGRTLVQRALAEELVELDAVADQRCLDPVEQDRDRPGGNDVDVDRLVGCAGDLRRQIRDVVALVSVLGYGSCRAPGPGRIRRAGGSVSRRR